MRETNDECKVWVGNIPHCFTPDDVKQHFMRWGLPAFKEIMLRTAHHETSWAIVAFNSAYEATQKYLSMTSGRPLSYSEPYQAQAWESKDFSRAVDKDLRDLEASAPVTLLTSRSSVNSGQTSRRSREERLASLQGTVQRQGDLSMA